MPVSHKNCDSMRNCETDGVPRGENYTVFCFEKFAHLLSGCFVKWFTQNQAVSLIVHSGSMKQCSLQLAGDIFNTAKESNIKIEAELIPRSFSEKALYLNKIVD